ncbi:MAG TPA: hypothetical protein VFV34_10625, partial [Blastocatellia bacterium]|nr:hypothetical protein [Blastocatellia bacterium]
MGEQETNRDPIEQRVRRIIAAELGVPELELTSGSKLIDLPWNADDFELEVLVPELVMRLETEFD